MIEGMTGMALPAVKCEECDNHIATINMDLGETWGEIALCGLCSLQMLLVLRENDGRG